MKRRARKVGWVEPSETQRWNPLLSFQPTRLMIAVFLLSIYAVEIAAFADLYWAG